MPHRTSTPEDAAGSQATAEELPLKRERAGRYLTRDGRFAVEQNSGRWMLLDTEQTDELGLPLVRGPFGSLDDARDAIRAARTGPTPTSPLEGRAATTAKADEKRAGGRAGPKAYDEPPAPPSPPPPPPLVVRRLEPGDGPTLRRLAEEAGEFEAAGARSAASPPPLDSVNARRFLARPDVHLLVASEGNELVGFALAYELLRRRGDPMELRVEEVAVRRSRRRQGIGRRLLEELWAIGRDRGAAGAIVTTRAGDLDGIAFLRATGGRPDREETASVRFSLTG
ncbi:MAG: GNAT family N-acetyltransferase [Chloroflexi bacterium]|nr:MAG: GNAT family N-acetyltransferase [Chloroflexota bacterium]